MQQFKNKNQDIVYIKKIMFSTYYGEQMHGTLLPIIVVILKYPVYSINRMEMYKARLTVMGNAKVLTQL